MDLKWELKRFAKRKLSHQEEGGLQGGEAARGALELQNPPTSAARTDRSVQWGRCAHIDTLLLIPDTGSNSKGVSALVRGL